MSVAVVFLPLLGALIAGALAFVHPRGQARQAPHRALAQRITCGALLASMVLAIFVFCDVVGARADAAPSSC